MVRSGRCAACAQGYYRRADANLGLGKVRDALNDFRRAAKVNARDPDLRKKLEQCEREVKRLRFEEALATPVRFGVEAYSVGHGCYAGLCVSFL